MAGGHSAVSEAVKKGDMSVQQRRAHSDYEPPADAVHSSWPDTAAQSFPLQMALVHNFGEIEPNEMHMATWKRQDEGKGRRRRRSQKKGERQKANSDFLLLLLRCTCWDDNCWPASKDCVGIVHKTWRR